MLEFIKYRKGGFEEYVPSLEGSIIQDPVEVIEVNYLDETIIFESSPTDINMYCLISTDSQYASYFQKYSFSENDIRSIFHSISQA
jgi:hypothetical protein